MKRLHVVLMFTFLLLGGNLFAQKQTIKGKVVNAATQEPLSGVNILVGGQKGGTTTKEDGTYSISVDKANNTLVFSFVGFQSQTVVIGDKKEINVQLVESQKEEEEVVIIGYGAQKKSHLTGSVSKFKNDNLEETTVSRLDQALQGKIAGVQIQNLSSEAGAEPRVRVRGLSSINAGSEPLVVVDGHPIPDGLAFVNMADVESVEVLKDAASAAIYGSRGASGVIIITTKSGKAEKASYNVKFSTGAKTQYELYPMMSTTEYTNLLFYEAALKAKDSTIATPTGTAIISNNERAAYIVEQTLLGGQGTDWQQEILRDASVQNLQVNVSGGTRQLKYFVSGGFQKDQGMLQNSEYDRFNLRTKLNAQLSKKVNLSFNLNPSYIKREKPSTGFIDFVRFQSFLPVYHTEQTAAFVNQGGAYTVKPGDFAQARHFNGLMYSGIMPDGSMWSPTGASSPFNTANNTPSSILHTRRNNTNEYRVQSAADLSIKILPDLEFKQTGSVYVTYSNGLDFAKRNSVKDGDVNRGIYNNRLYVDLLSESMFTYNKKIDKHSFTLLAGNTLQKTRTIQEQTVGMDYPSDNITTLNTALAIDQASTYNLRNSVGLISYLGRINYSYDNKYILSASYRTDGSSYFAPGNKWGSFPSISLGWVATEEEFLQNVDWLSNLKLRASYGVTGNNRIMDFAFVDLLYAANYPIGSGTGTVTTGQVPSSSVLANRNITWEKTFQYNGGIDLSLFNNAISISADVYKSKTDELLLQQSAMAFAGVPQSWNNIGSLENKGFEIEITTNNIRTKDLKWTTSANISQNKNKILELGEEAFLLNQGERTELYMNKVGGPLVQFYGYKTDGVWLSQAEIDKAIAAGLNSALSNVFVPGGLKLVDVNGDNVIDAEDRVMMGTPYPKFTWGISNNFSYKNFDLSFMFQGIQGGQLINGDANYNETKRYNKNYTDNRWVSPMYPGDGKTPYSTVGFNWMLTDYVVEDASYFALREVIAGYTFNVKKLKAVKLSSLRVYFSAQNLFFQSASGYKGINTEARMTGGVYNTPLVDGYQRGGFPMPKTFMFGIDVNF